MDIVTRTSDGRVLTVADAITLSDNAYVVTKGHHVELQPLNTFGFDTGFILNVGTVPSDLVEGINYNYVSGSFVLSGQVPPAPPPHVPADITAAQFTSLGLAVNSSGFNRMLAGMPAITILLNQYQGTAGLRYGDATDPTSAVGALMTEAVQAGYITTQNITDFLALWFSTY